MRYEKQPQPSEFPPATVVNGRREVKVLQYRDRTFGMFIWLHVEVDTGLFVRHRYWSLSVPRGRRKLSLEPVGRRFATAQEAFAYGRALVVRMAGRLATKGFVGQTEALNQFTRYSLPGGDNYTEWLITAPNLVDEYWGEHFDLPNIVAHVRTTERVTPRGTRLLVMEEIQSDWNQTLREAIQQSQRAHLVNRADEDDADGDTGIEMPPDNPYLNHWLDAALRMMLLAAERGCCGMAWLPGKLHAERFPWANADGLATFYDRIVPAAVTKLAKPWGVQTGMAQFSTLSRHYGVRQQRGMCFHVVILTNGRPVGDEFADFTQAETFRRSLETRILEEVATLFLSPKMSADILKNGLACLGAIGRRPVAAPLAPAC